jgi:GT2 family glycosyltransferase
MKKTDLSVIILSYNTADFLKNCLNSVKKACQVASGTNIEIIVVDNASKDESVAMVKENFPGVKLIKSRKNLGFSGGNNLGLARAQGQFVLFLNSDTEVAPHTFAKLIKYLARHPKVGAISAKTLLPSGELDPDCHRGFPHPWAALTYFLGLEKLFPRSLLFGQYHCFFKNLDQIHEIDAGAGAFMFVRAQTLQEVGAWDESYFFYGEDLDLFYRIKNAGWKIVFYPQALVTHYKGVSSGLRKESKKITKADRKTRLKVAKASVQAMEIFYKKFYQNKYPRWLTRAVLTGIKIKGKVRIIKHCLMP